MENQRLHHSFLSSAQVERCIEQPGVNDVVCGRGANANRHPGNIMFRNIVKTQQSAYLSASGTDEKHLIVMSIIKVIANFSPPGRFITQDPSTKYWFVVGEDMAKRKTSQALREKGSKRGNKNQQQQQQPQQPVQQIQFQMPPPSAVPPSRGKMKKEKSIALVVMDDEDNDDTEDVAMEEKVDTGYYNTPHMQKQLQERICSLTKFINASEISIETFVMEDMDPSPLQEEMSFCL